MANLGVTDHLGFSTLLSIGVAGALLGFLKFNYPPAKIYMGDGGAYFLGFLIGLLSIVNSNKGGVAAALIAPAFALALPIVDVSLAILRRAARGLPIFRPDQKHIHHHLITLGISRERTLLNLYTVSLLCLFLALCVFCLQGRMLSLYTGLLFLVLLIAGHLSGFTRNWYQIGSQLGKSLSLRKETRCALTLDRWLVLEAERSGSIQALWEDFSFVVHKLGFGKASMTLPEGVTHSWQSVNFNHREKNFHQAVHEISDGTVIELVAGKEMSEVLFNLLGDLAAETWFKAAARFRGRKDSKAADRPGGSVSKAMIGFENLEEKPAVAVAELAKP
jgi:UDP-GlcNAc:undecaprenyl-phosphate GlcNAc-1-phosphate transferase